MNELYRKKRVAFVINGCEHCRVLKSFLDKFNFNLPIEKQIQILDCTKYHDLGIIEHPLIRAYKEHIKGLYPTIFIDGAKIQGANTVEETKIFLQTLLGDELILEIHNPYVFGKNCFYKKRWFGGKKLVCQ